MSDMYSEVGHSQLRRLVHQTPEWAVNRLVAERERADQAEAELARLRDELVMFAAAVAYQEGKPGRGFILTKAALHAAPRACEIANMDGHTVVTCATYAEEAQHE